MKSAFISTQAHTWDFGNMKVLGSQQMESTLEFKMDFRLKSI